MSEQKYHSNVSALGPQHRAFVLGSALRWRRPPWLDIGCLGLLAAAILLPLRGLYNATGSTMEEGFMLYFPERMIKGDIANVDFLHLSDRVRSMRSPAGTACSGIPWPASAHSGCCSTSG